MGRKSRKKNFNKNNIDSISGKEDMEIDNSSVIEEKEELKIINAIFNTRKEILDYLDLNSLPLGDFMYRNNFYDFVLELLD
jgi:hypothetical protein